MVLIAMLTAIAGEFKVIPFSGEAFRFGLGSATFFLLLLNRRPKSYLWTGIVTGVTVMVFRTLMDSLGDSFSLFIGLQTHFPAGVFYMLYGMGLGLLPLDRLQEHPLRLGGIAALLEFSVNTVEHLLRLKFVDYLMTFEQREWFLLLLVALFRSYFVVGLYSSIRIPEERKRMEKMLEVGSGLYGETLYLQKSMDHIERITASSYELYRSLKGLNQADLARQALNIAQQIHEVKKDSQRILSGLVKLYVPEKTVSMRLAEVLHVVVKGNEKYSELLGKKIRFRLSTAIEWETESQIALLAVLNNLVANAVEAIEQEGDIHLTAVEKEGFTVFVVQDTGKGIAPQDTELIFEPGFTTKFNEKGVAATGIGLSHVKEIVKTLEGECAVRSSSAGTCFEIRLPTEKIRKRDQG